MEANYLGGKHSDMSSGKTIHKESLPSESKTASLTKPQYLAISEHSLVKGTPENIEAWLMSSQVDSLVSHSQLRVSEKQAMMSETCGQQRWALSKVSIHPLCSLRTYQDCLAQQWTTNQTDMFTTSERYSETFPKAGTMSNGVCWELMMSERHTTEKDYGFSEYIPTPDANMGARGTQQNWVKVRPSGHTASYTINQFVRDGRVIPTPTAADHRDRGGPSIPAIARRKEKGKSIELSMTVDGALNPNWVEWLMGWPIGVTDLRPLAMDKFHYQWLAPMRFYLRSLLMKTEVNWQPSQEV